MKVSIIPPASDPTWAMYSDDYHLCLSHELWERPALLRFYQDRVNANHFVILDNSAHETGFGDSAEKLMELIRQLRPSEVVLPDRLFMGEDTVEGSIVAAQMFRKELEPEVRPRFMVAPQGRTPDEWFDCLKGLLRQVRPDTVGISKDYEVWDGGLRQLALLVADTWNVYHTGEPTIHMLGWGRQLTQLQKLRHLSFIRGVDSAKPLVYALNNMRLSPSMSISPKYPGRSNYFNAEFDQSQSRHAIVNIETFKLMAGSPSAATSLLV